MRRLSRISTGAFTAALALLGTHGVAARDYRPATVSHYRVVFSFGRSQGFAPRAGLIADSTGALYGTAAHGGGPWPFGRGVVFKLTPNAGGYTESVIHVFRGYREHDGSIPDAPLIRDAGGSLYGTTYTGGRRLCPEARRTRGLTSCGTVFRLSPAGSGYVETVLYAFRGGTDGANPATSLVADATGALYGTTEQGGVGCYHGNGCGTVFKLTPSSSGYKERILYRFQGFGDGYAPSALIIDAAGALYGTTYTGGPAREGTVFKLTPSAGGYTKSLLYSFGAGGAVDGVDGACPDASLIAGRDGALYGTTVFGGGSQHCGRVGCGTVFALRPAGARYVGHIVHAFSGENGDGFFPSAPVIEGADGTLYGTTFEGGMGAIGFGMVFALAPGSMGYTERVLVDFGDDARGRYPQSGLLDVGGKLVGALPWGGVGRGGPQYGLVFSLAP
jgi:uncharacterized repeat protein (TIGR03803 family)